MNRRRFLQRCPWALAVIGSGVSSGHAAEAAGGSAPAWRLRLATSSNHFRELSLEGACARIAALGYEAVDLWSAYEDCQHLDDALNRLGPDRLRDLLARLHLKLFSFSTYVGGYARYAELLGAVGGGVAVQGSTSPCPPEELSRRMKEFLESQKPLIELAEKHHSYLAIENHGHALLDSLDSFKAFTDLNTAPRLGIALAPYHLQARGASVEEAIRLAGSQLFYFYAWQHEEGMRQLPGLGSTDFRPWLQALAAVRYRGYVNPFMHGHVEPDAMSAALGQTRDYLRRLI